MVLILGSLCREIIEKMQEENSPGSTAKAKAKRKMPSDEDDHSAVYDIEVSVAYCVVYSLSLRPISWPPCRQEAPSVACRELVGIISFRLVV